MTQPAPPPPSYYAEVQADKPALYWRMDGQSTWDTGLTGSIPDRSGAGRFATTNYIRCTAASLITNDPNPAGAMQTTNASNNDYGYALRDYEPWMQMDTFTLEAVVKIGTSGIHGLWARDPGSGVDRAWQWRINTNVLEFINVTPADGSASTFAVGTTGVTTDTVRHVAVVVTPTTIQNYVDGVADGPLVSHGGWRLTGTHRLELALLVGNTGYWTSGTLDEPAVYPTALSAARIAAHAAAVTAGTAPPPTRYSTTGSVPLFYDNPDTIIVTPRVDLSSTRAARTSVTGSTAAKTTGSYSSMPRIDMTGITGRSLAYMSQVNNKLTRRVTAGIKDGEPDWPIRTPGKAISGTVYGAGNLRIPGATVKLFRQHDDKYIRQLTTDDNGNYVFVRDMDDPYQYYVIAYTDALIPQVHGMSDRGQVPK